MNNTFKKYLRYNFLICAIIYVANCSAQDTSTSRDNEIVSYLASNFKNKINTVIVDKNNVTIKGSVAANSGNIYICELRMFDNARLISNSFVSATPVTTSNATFQIQLKRFGTADNETYDRIYSRFIITSKSGAKYTALSYAHYADNIDDAALQYLPEEKPLGKKGLEGFFQESRESDLQDLGIQNVTVNITLPQVISLVPTAYSYNFNGHTYYMNTKTIDAYDREFKLCSDQNVFVSAVILIQRNSAPDIKSILVDPNSNAGVESMANITSQQGFNYFTALISFLAERYSRPDKQYGRVSNWIVHNEVDNGVYWTNAGNAKIHYYTELYDRCMRTVYYAVRQYNPAAKVFISLTHGWAVAAKPTFYAPKNMLAFLNEMCIKQGDYEWGVAFHAYSEDITNPTPWVDKDATMDLNSTHIITPKNIELIDAWMRAKAHLYKGQKVRTLLFSEQGANTKSYSKEDMQMQAAVIAYMWKKCSRLPSAESFDYHAQCDNRNESGLKFGLWTVKAGTIATPDQKKTSWNVYQAAGTSSEDNAFAFALPVIGINNWQQSYNQLSSSALPCIITFNVKKSGNNVNDVSVYFDGEMHKTINGSATFYNVAALPGKRTCLIKADGQTIFQNQQVSVTKDQVIQINLN